MSVNRLGSFRVSFIAFAAFLVGGAFQSAYAQGCIAARSNQGIMDELCDSDTVSSSSARNPNPEWLRPLTVNIGFREFNSFRHFIGTVEQNSARRQSHASSCFIIFYGRATASAVGLTSPFRLPINSARLYL